MENPTQTFWFIRQFKLIVIVLTKLEKRENVENVINLSVHREHETKKIMFHSFIFAVLAAYHKKPAVHLTITIACMNITSSKENNLDLLQVLGSWNNVWSVSYLLYELLNY